MLMLMLMLLLMLTLYIYITIKNKYLNKLNVFKMYKVNVNVIVNVNNIYCTIKNICTLNLKC